MSGIVRAQGVTLIELMVTLAVAAILVSMAAPSYTTMMREHRLATSTNVLHAALMLARSESIKRGRRVTLCTSSDGAQCATGVGWHAGWLLFEDANGNAQVDSQERIIRSAGAMSSGVTATGNATLANYVSYVPSGTTRAVTGALQMGTIRLCTAGSGRRLVISATGRIRTNRLGCV